MGVVSLSRVASYWSTQWPFSSESIRKVLSRDRFQLISKFLHLSDNSTYVTRGQDGHDRLYKIRPLITYLISSFKNSYIPDRELSADESMVSYKGRLSFFAVPTKETTKMGHEGLGISWVKNRVIPGTGTCTQGNLISRTHHNHCQRGLFFLCVLISNWRDIMFTLTISTQVLTCVEGSLRMDLVAVVQFGLIDEEYLKHSEKRSWKKERLKLTMTDRYGLLLC